MGKIHYYSLNEYLRNTFGRKVYKVSIDGGFTCPNRDGHIGTGGCIFCSAGGSGDFAESRSLSVHDQIEAGKKKVEAKLPKDGSAAFIAYFQAFTNTYGKIEDLRAKYTEAAEHPDVVAVSIATRPDCLGGDVLKLLSEINLIKPVWVELGLQTVHERSAEYIRRGYKTEVYDLALKNLHELNIQVITHVILGLPGETKEDMLETVKHVCDADSDGIKLQLLHVLKGTDLALDYEAGKFKVLTMEEYVDIVKACVSILPETMVVHRLTGDGDKRILLAPEWSRDKKRVMNAITRALNGE